MIIKLVNGSKVIDEMNISMEMNCFVSKVLIRISNIYRVLPMLDYFIVNHPSWSSSIWSKQYNNWN